MPTATSTALRREIVSETRVLDADHGLVEYVASDQSLDSYRELILASGWRFNLFQRNAPFVDSHDYSSIERLLGRVVDCRVEGDQLIETVQWAHDVPENALARLGWKMTLAGHLRAVSVGFVPLRTLSKFDANPRPYEERVRTLGLEQNPPVRIYAEQEQIELSACLIGANPNALARAHREGAISDGDLASVGIGDRAAAFLHEACGLMDRISAAETFPLPAAHASATARLRDALAAQFGRLIQQRHTTPFRDGLTSDPETERNRENFLHAFQSILNP